MQRAQGSDAAPARVFFVPQILESRNAGGRDVDMGTKSATWALRDACR
jgi:hypothetical protein